MLHTQLAALALAAATLAVSGCGGSSKTASTSTATAQPTTAATTTAATTTVPATAAAIKIRSGRPLTRAAWIAEAEVICARTNVELDSTKIKTVQDYARVLPQLASYDRIEATELSKIVPPTVMASDWRLIVTGFQKFGEYTERVAEYAEANNFNGATPTYRVAKATHERLAKIAKHDGFKECAVI
jgi:hypothetical protein